MRKVLRENKLKKQLSTDDDPEFFDTSCRGTLRYLFWFTNSLVITLIQYLLVIAFNEWVNNLI